MTHLTELRKKVNKSALGLKKKVLTKKKGLFITNSIINNNNKSLVMIPGFFDNLSRDFNRVFNTPTQTQMNNGAIQNRVAGLLAQIDPLNVEEDKLTNAQLRLGATVSMVVGGIYALQGAVITGIFFYVLGYDVYQIAQNREFLANPIINAVDRTIINARAYWTQYVAARTINRAVLNQAEANAQIDNRNHYAEALAKNTFLPIWKIVLVYILEKQEADRRQRQGG